MILLKPPRKVLPKKKLYLSIETPKRPCKHNTRGPTTTKMNILEIYDNGENSFYLPKFPVTADSKS